MTEVKCQFLPSVGEHITATDKHGVLTSGKVMKISHVFDLYNINASQVVNITIV